jgi:hypothetical protein
MPWQATRLARRDRMMNLLFKDGHAVLTCSTCARSWRIDTSEPFVPQLRTRLLGHRCDGRRVISLEDRPVGQAEPAGRVPSSRRPWQRHPSQQSRP